MLTITKQKITRPVYDITVKDTSNFYANNILVHNCAEITLPTTPFEGVNDENGRIALCTLSAINWGNIKKPEDFEKPCELAVRALDSLLTYQDFPAIQAELSTKEFRTLGIGIINLAYFLAKNNMRYDGSAFETVDEYMEAMAFYLTKASVQLAKEQGPCQLSAETKYGIGQFPWENRKKEIDEIIPHKTRFDWEGLRSEMAQYGIRNATLMALMPSECQSLDNEILMKDGSKTTLEKLIREYGNISIEDIHSNPFMIGQRFSFLKPVELSDSIAHEFYYNGPKEIIEIEFEDGSSYKFTENHRLLVDRGGSSQWIEIKDLRENDNVVSVNTK